MGKILQYTLIDLLRSRWAYLYFGFFLLFTIGVAAFSTDGSKLIISLMNVILILCPLIAMLFGLMYYYHSREFIELLLAQPIRRMAIFWGQYLGVALSLSLSLALGTSLPFLFSGFQGAEELPRFLTLIGNGVLLSFIFSGLGYLIALKFDNRIRGFGVGLLIWLFFAIVYDGIFLLLLLAFRDYPLEKLSLGLSMFNPIDLSRILILLQLDISALMGYTGAVFQKFFGTQWGMLLTVLALSLWLVAPALSIRWVAIRKDF